MALLWGWSIEIMCLHVVMSDLSHSLCPFHCDLLSLYLALIPPSHLVPAPASTLGATGVIKNQIIIITTITITPIQCLLTTSPSSWAFHSIAPKYYFKKKIIFAWCFTIFLWRKWLHTAHAGDDFEGIWDQVKWQLQIMTRIYWENLALIFSFNRKMSNSVFEGLGYNVTAYCCLSHTQRF